MGLDTKFAGMNPDMRNDLRSGPIGATQYHWSENPKGTLYIAGPMRGRPRFNFPAFFAAEAILHSRGWATINPASMDNVHYGADVSVDNVDGSEETAAAQYGFTIAEAMKRDAAMICEFADGLYMLRDWELSTGARAEHALAVALHLPIYYEGTLP
jgi:hypothetical protein